MSTVVKPTANTALQFDDFTQVHSQSSLASLNQFHDQEEVSKESTPALLPECNKTYEDGLEEGRLQANYDAENRAGIAEAFAAKLQKITEAMEQSHGRVIKAVLQAVLPALAKQAAAQEIKEFILTLSAQALRGQVILTTHPDNLETLEQIICDIPETTQAVPAFIVETDSDLSGHAVEAHWQGGAGTIDLEGAVERVLNLLQTQ